MLIKVCGNKGQNALEVAKTSIDWMGFIFYPKSKRFVNRSILSEIIQQFPESIQKVGVYVDENINQIQSDIQTFGLNLVQLHGNESPEFCKQIGEDIKLIKAFRLDNKFDFLQLEKYRECDYFLFDAKGKDYGGNGIKYNWEILNNYNLDIPFLLAGGIGPSDAEEIRKIDHSSFAGIDINSGFEKLPGEKNIHLIKEFIKELSCNIQ